MSDLTKHQLIAQFNENDPATNTNIFGLPFKKQHAEVVILPVPWEVTVSYKAGTAQAPAAITKASWQVDLFDPFVKDAWKIGVWKAPANAKIAALNKTFRPQAEAYLDALLSKNNSLKQQLQDINNACETMVKTVKQDTQALLAEGKKVVLLGGDHSTPLGFLQALAEVHNSFGILQIDAHADLRNAYEGFTYSHASIMHNALQINEVTKLVQVGIRDYCQEEVDAINAKPTRVKTFFDRELKHQQFAGQTWAQQTEQIVGKLPQKVYVSFDIDGLDPKLCPNTGTPVAGGFETEEVLFLLERVVQSGRQIIGLDLNEVSPGKDEWDANVAARLLYRLCNILGSQNR